MLSLATFVKAAKKCAFDTSMSDAVFLNLLLEPYVIAGRVTARGGKDFFLDKCRVSKILSGSADVPQALRKALTRHGLERATARECAVVWDEVLNPLYFEELKADVLSLIDESDSFQSALAERLQGKFNDPSDYLACALIGVIGLSNKPESGGLLWRRGTGSLGWLVGDLFHYGFKSRKKRKNLVVIPVDCTFESHVTRGYEGVEFKRVSENTLHGKWLMRMAQSGILEPELKERLSYELEGVSVDQDGCYPIGTVATLETAKSVFLLLAISRFDENGNARSTAVEISDALDSLLQHYDRLGQGADMYLPLMGTGLSRAGLATSESFKMIVDAVTEKASFVGGSVTIVLLRDAAKELGLVR